MADGYLGGFSQQRAADVNYLAQLDQMRRQQAQLELDRRRQAAQESQFSQEFGLRQRNAEQSQQTAQDQIAAQQENAQAQAVAQMLSDDSLSQSLGRLKERTHVSDQEMARISQQQRQAGARNALKEAIAGDDTSIQSIGKAILPYDTGTGISLIKAAKEEERQRDLLARTGGTGVQPQAGYRWTASGDMEAIPGGGADPDVIARLEAAKNIAKPPKQDDTSRKETDAKDVLMLLDMAAPFIDKGTGSYIGAGMNEVGRAFGYAPESAGANARLQAIEGMLISKMPKMSGPQSDKDVLLYKQMAGQIGDPTIPASSKQAAMDAIREINERYVVSKDPGGTSNAKQEIQQQPSSQKTFNAPPDPRQFDGRTLTDPSTGIKLLSRGGQWVRVK